MDSRPIALFDSGVGGLSILREIARLLPWEDTLYFADKVNCPYGELSLPEVRGLSQGITRFLLSKEAKVIVVACNTASAAALQRLRTSFPKTPFIGMVPAIKPAATLTHSRRVGVLATPATFQGELFADVVSRFATDVEVVAQACPGLVEKVEEGDLCGSETAALLDRYVTPLLQEGVDTLVLGCTHYTFLIPLLRDMVGEGINIVDPSPAIARQTKHVLTQFDMLKTDALPGKREFYASGDALALSRTTSYLIGKEETFIEVQWQQDGKRLLLS
ncbi:MAG: glutamate racemase [Anaerolineae bacterium]|nr:glutamate racemase [Anaerolineae bacterium]